MNFVLVPFLLAVRVLPNEDGWINGPEYTFDVRVGTISAHQDQDLLGSSLLCKLKCSPKEPDRLICHIEEPKITKLSPKAFNLDQTKPWKNATFSPLDYNATTFEIKFHDNGIHNYAVKDENNPTVDFRWDINRMIANQLSIGTNLKGKGKSFQTTENFTVGECLTDYTIERDKFKSDRTTKTFALISLTDLDIRNDERINITRWRYISTCRSHSNYSFGTRYTYDVVLRDTVEKLHSSTTHMRISKYSLASETVNILHLYSANKKRLGSILDHIYLSLESVQPAKPKLERIDNPTFVDITGKTFRNAN